MHIIISDQYDKESTPSVMCVDRAAHSCTILRAEVEKIDTLVNMARALKAPYVRVVIAVDDEAATKVFESLGFKHAGALIVMEKTL